jgi:hypothetical protein
MLDTFENGVVYDLNIRDLKSQNDNAKRLANQIKNYFLTKRGSYVYNRNWGVTLSSFENLKDNDLSNATMLFNSELKAFIDLTSVIAFKVLAVSSFYDNGRKRKLIRFQILASFDTSIQEIVI